jgi:hypothetical protein
MRGHGLPEAETTLVVAGPTPPSQCLEATVDRGLERGHRCLVVVRQGDDPQVVLPVSMRSVLALSHSGDVTGTVEGIVELALLAGEERRVFVSYAHDRFTREEAWCRGSRSPSTWG